MFLKRYFFSSGQNIRNSTKVLLDLQNKYSKAAKKPNDRLKYKSFKDKNNKKNPTDRKKDLKRKIHNLENPLRQAKYFKESTETIPFYDETMLQKKIFSSKSPESLFSLYDGHKFTFSIKNIITTFTVYAKLLEENKKTKKIQDKRFISLVYMASENLTQMNNIEKVLLYWALSKLQANENILETLTHTLANSINVLPFKHLAIFTWCLAKNKIRNAEIFGRVSLRICEILSSDKKIEILDAENTEENTKSKDIKNENSDSDDILKSDIEFDSDEYDDEIQKIENSLVKIPIKQISSHSLTIILWAFAKTRMKDEELFEKIGTVIIENFEKFSAKMLNIVLFSYKTLKIKSKVNELISEKIYKNELDLSKESILTLKTYVISLSKLKFESATANVLKIVNLIFDRSQSKHQKISSKFLSEIIWNLALLKCYDKNLLKKMEADVVGNIHLMNEIDVTQCFYSYCVFTNLSKKREFNKILDLLVERMNIFKKRLNKKSIKIIKDGKELINYKHKNLNFI